MADKDQTVGSLNIIQRWKEFVSGYHARLFGAMLYTPNGDSMANDTADAVKAILSANSGVDIGDVDETPVTAAAGDINAPAANTAAVVTYAANATNKHVITGIAWSYAGGIPTGGNLKVEDVSGTTVFTMDITEDGAGIIVFPKPKKGAAVNTAMIVTLAAGGAGVTGKVSVLNHYVEA